MKILVFSLKSEKVVLGQGHEGQGQGRRSKVTRVKVVYQGNEGQGQIGQLGQRLRS